MRTDFHPADAGDIEHSEHAERRDGYPYPTVRRSGLDVLLIGIVTVAASLAGAAGGQFLLHPGVFFPGFFVSIGIFLASVRG